MQAQVALPQSKILLHSWVQKRPLQFGAFFTFVHEVEWQQEAFMQSES